MLVCIVFVVACEAPTNGEVKSGEHTIGSPNSIIHFDAPKLIALADQYLEQAPVPITTFSCPRSKGGIHDFYSEGDYWWPNPDDPDGPYIRKDGQSNPDNFVAHRKAMRDLNRWVATLVAAYQWTKNEKYAAHALLHLNAFFLNKNTLMNPSLLYAQAIKGRVTGRGIGIIDSIHLIEITKAIEVLASLDYLKGAPLVGLKNWFNDYADWLNTHPYGLDEKDHGNNHSTWWAAQLAAFAHLAQREDLLEVARLQFKKLLPEQMAKDGSFPEELSRTKPYNYSLFNLEGYAVLCQIASTKEDNLWNFESENGRFEKAWTFMLPYIKDKSNWIKAPDVQYFDELPIQSPGLLFTALAYQNEDFLTTWQSLDPERKSEEIIRTYPIWQPTLWVDHFESPTDEK
ncbi:MAG: alginate lyase family protein [Bacteroidota bacterium]